MKKILQVIFGIPLMLIYCVLFLFLYGMICAVDLFNWIVGPEQWGEY